MEIPNDDTVTRTEKKTLQQFYPKTFDWNNYLCLLKYVVANAKRTKQTKLCVRINKPTKKLRKRIP